MATCGEVLVKILENYGIKTLFGIPGVHTVELYRGIENTALTHITPRHEQGAAFMGATYGRLTGKVGVCIATLGPGATNFITPAAYAQLGAFPMLMITGQKPIKHSKQRQFQIVNIVEMMAPITIPTTKTIIITPIIAAAIPVTASGGSSCCPSSKLMTIATLPFENGGKGQGTRGARSGQSRHRGSPPHGPRTGGGVYHPRRYCQDNEISPDHNSASTAGLLWKPGPRLYHIAWKWCKNKTRKSGCRFVFASI